METCQVIVRKAKEHVQYAKRIYTSYDQLKHRRKTMYLGYRRFLKKYHPYHRLKKAFNGHQEHAICPTPLSGLEIYGKIKNVNVTFGKMKNKQIVSEIRE